MKKKDCFKGTATLIVVSALACILFAIAGISQCTFIKKYPQDNVVEEYLEDLLEKKTGIDVDLSPGTPEE